MRKRAHSRIFEHFECIYSLIDVKLHKIYNIIESNWKVHVKREEKRQQLHMNGEKIKGLVVANVRWR